MGSAVAVAGCSSFPPGCGFKADASATARADRAVASMALASRIMLMLGAVLGASFVYNLFEAVRVA